MSIRKFFAFAFASTVMVSCNNGPKNVTSLNNQLDSVSYAVGLSMANQLKVNSFDEVNLEILQQAMRNGIDSTNLLIDFKDIQACLTPYFQKKQQEAQKERERENEIKYAENRKAGEDFLATNKSKKGVVTTGSGLQYIVLKEGKGASPKSNSKVKVHYHGTVLSGEVFDSSVERKTPNEFYANQVIRGWTEGLQLMKVGAKYKFFIPQELAYGAQSRGAIIKPFSMLIFEVELLDIVE